MNEIRVLLVDDHQMLRDGLRSLLVSKEYLQVIGEASSGKEAIQRAQDMVPDVVILDLGLPDMNGMDVMRAIKENRPDVKIVVLSMHISREYVKGAVEAGCDGYIPKSSTHTSLLDAIQVVMEGERFLHPKAASALVASITEEKSTEDLLQDLSDRELEVVRFTAMGFTSKESGQKLNISPKTVDTYRSRAMNKLGLQQRSELIRFALQAGLLDDILEE